MCYLFRFESFCSIRQFCCVHLEICQPCFHDVSLENWHPRVQLNRLEEAVFKSNGEGRAAHLNVFEVKGIAVHIVGVDWPNIFRDSEIRYLKC